MTETLQGSLLARPGLCKQDLEPLQRQAVLQWEDDGVSPSHTEEQQGRGTTRGDTAETGELCVLPEALKPRVVRPFYTFVSPSVIK